MRNLLIVLAMVVSIGVTEVVYLEYGHRVSIAQWGYGRTYDLGDRAVPQNDEKAAKWYRKAAERGHAGAQHDLGVLFEKGRGVPQDTMAALMWLTISLMNADAEATPNARTMESKARIVATLAPSHRMFPPEFDELIAKRVQMDVVEAELMAIRCVLSLYNNCG